MTGGLGRTVALGMGALVVVVALVGTAAAGGTGGLFGATSGDVAPTPAASAIPADYLALYQAAAATCPGLSWTVLAAIGTVESGNGTSQLPGVHSGANPAGAEGPMQFEPATFSAYDEPVPPGGVTPPSPYDPTDAIYAAARLLCANGAGSGNVAGAVYDYNHTDAYVSEVLTLAASYGQPVVAATPPAAAATTALTYAEAQIGTPYRWGGETPGVAFDCSGLVQAAYAAAGVTLPRVAQTQFDAGPHVPAGTPLEPGDLVFFGGSAADVEHVGMVMTPGVMIDAPYTGADVREDAFPTAVGAAFGGMWYLGATRPAS
ncbi:MAG: C40 family peptidase [Acidimicrobiales bacterium]